MKTMRKTASNPASLNKPTLSPSGKADKDADKNKVSMTFTGDDQKGKHFGSKSCRGWDHNGHVIKRESAKMALNTFQRPYSDLDSDLRPSAIYMRKYRES